MSLKSKLQNEKEFKNLMNKLPNLKHLFKNYVNEEGGYTIKPNIVSPRIEGSHPQDVGTAYDYFIRANIQKINKVHIEKELPSQVKHGLEGLKKSPFYNYGKEKLELEITRSWQVRNDYILNKSVNEEELCKAMIILSYAEDYYRSSGRSPVPREMDYGFPKEKDVEDLKQLVKVTIENDSLFKAKDKNSLIFNPTFGESSIHLGGADGDLIIDGMLIDFKTDNAFGYKSKYIYQIISYYILSKENKIISLKNNKGKIIIEYGKPYEVDKIGIYYARFNKIVYISIKELEYVLKENEMNLGEFCEEFYKIARETSEILF